MKVRSAKRDEDLVEPEGIGTPVEEPTEEAKEDQWEDVAPEDGEAKWEPDPDPNPLEKETEDITNQKLYNKEHPMVFVDTTGIPEFMKTHLRPLAKWTPLYGETSATNARLQWYKKAVEYMKVFFALSFPRAEIKKRFGIGDVTYDALEARLMEKEGGKFLSMSVAQRYYIYVLQMESCIRMLSQYVHDNIYDANDKKANVVNAIKTIANIHKDTLLTGRELGLIKVEEKGPRQLGEIDLAKMDTEALKELFEQRFVSFKQVINDATVLSGPYARLLLEEKKKVFDVNTEEALASKERN